MTHAIERVLRRDRAILIAGLATIALLAWAYIHDYDSVARH